MTEWKEYELSDLMEIKYGKDHKHLADGNYPLYGSGGIMRFVEKHIYDGETILIPRKGSLSNLFYINEPFWSVDTMFWSKINKKLTWPKYLFYTLKTYDLASLDVGSAVPSLTTVVLNRVKISLPDLPTQTAIAEILSSLDDKIELNNNINKELEKLAQTLFKQWFIDFEFPNENGEPYQSSGGEMVESELGMIPKNWEVRKLSALIRLTGGGTPKRSNAEYWDGKIKWFSIQDIPNDSQVFVVDTKEKITELGLNKSSTKLLPRGTTIITARGTVGKLALVAEPMAMNQSCYGVNGASGLGEFYTYFNLKNAVEKLRQNVHGAVFDTITSNTFDTIKSIYGNNDLANLFEEIVRPMMEQIENHCRENQELSNLRDTLLPKLISGELNVKDL